MIKFILGEESFAAVIGLVQHLLHHHVPLVLLQAFLGERDCGLLDVASFYARVLVVI